MTRRLTLGSCPDSWGVWYAEDPRQPPWPRFLDELAAVGYEWLELGPYGYLPTDPARLGAELAARGLRVAAGTVHGASGLHLAADWPEIEARTRAVARLTAVLGGRHVVFVPVPGYRDDATGAYTGPAELDADGWATLVAAANLLGRLLDWDYGLRLQFHPHADSHVETQPQIERFLDETDPAYVGLCLDTGHVAYRHGDSVALVERHAPRIGHVHVKQVDPVVLAAAETKDLAFGQAVAAGVCCEPPGGEPDLAAVLPALLTSPGDDLFAIVEQDLYPVDLDVPGPLAGRTRSYLDGLGVGR